MIMQDFAWLSVLGQHSISQGRQGLHVTFFHAILAYQLWRVFRMRSIKHVVIATILLGMSTAYADENPSVTQGAATYDWQSCVSKHKDSCINDCQTSEDIDCDNNCDYISIDKCKSEGLSPPQ